MADNEYDDSAPPPSIGCCGWLIFELPCCGTVSFFDLKDANGRTLDISKTFSTDLPWDIYMVKVILWGLVVSTYAWGFYDYTFTHWFMAYISYWTLLYSCVYMSLSLWVATSCGKNKNKDDDDAGGAVSAQDQPESASFLQKATWLMFSVSAVHGITVVLMFWLTEYGPNYTLSYFIIMSHGVTFFIVVMDGLWVNRIPVRLKHYTVTVFFALLFVGWTLIQAYLNIDNPWTDDEEEAAGASENLYNVLNWEEDPTAAAIFCILVLFVVLPLFTLLLWGLSLIKRHYIEDDDTTANKKRKAKEAKIEAPEVQITETIEEAA